MDSNPNLKADVERALKFFPTTAPTIEELLEPLLYQLPVADCTDLLTRWAERSKLPRSFIDRIAERLEEIEVVPANKAILQTEIDRFWSRARELGWQPSDTPAPVKIKPPRVKKEKPVADTFESTKRLPSGFFSFDGCTYWHKAMFKKEFPLPGDPIQPLIDAELVVLCFEAEIEPLERIEYVIEGQGRMYEKIRVCYKIRLKNNYHITQVDLQPDDLGKPEAFSKLLLGQGFPKWKCDKLIFEWFVDWLIKSEVPHVREIPHWGQIEPGVFLFENGIFDASKKLFHQADEEFRIEWKGKAVVCPSGDSTMKPPIYVAPAEKAIKEMKATLELWEEINGLLNVRTLVSWAIGSLFSDHIIKGEKFSKGFPMIFAYGDAGTGKSSALDLLMKMFGCKQPNRQSVSKDSTTKGLSRKMTKVHTFPFYLDDFRDHTKPGYKNVPDLSQSMLNWYHHLGGTIAMKTTDNSTHSYPMNAGVILTGNDLPPDAAARMRHLILYFTRKLSQNETAKLSALEMAADSLSIFVPLLLGRYNEIKKAFFDNVEDHFKAIYAYNLPSRVAHHWAYVFSAYDVYQNFFDKSWSEKREAFQNEALQILIADQKRSTEDVPLHRFFEALDFGATIIDSYRDGKPIFAIDRHCVRLIKGRWEAENGKIFNDVLAIHIADAWQKLALKNSPVTKDVTLSNLDYLIEQSSFFIKKSHQTRFQHPDGTEVTKRAYVFDAAGMESMHLMPALFHMLRKTEDEPAKKPTATQPEFFTKAPF